MKTIKMKKVLIALDYDPTAQKVAEVGFSMAKSMKAEVILLHVITDPVLYATAGYSPIMGFNGYIDVGLVATGKCRRAEEMHHFNILINQNNTWVIKPFRQ